MTITTDSTPLAVGSVVHLPLSQLRMTGLNPRSIDEDELGDLDTLKTHQLHSLLVFPSLKVEGDYELVDGHRRLTAARRLGLDTLRCEIVDAPEGDADLLLDMLTSGTSGKALSTAEIADGIQGVLDLGVPLEEVTRRTGRGRRAKTASYGDVLSDAQDSLDAAFLVLQARELAAGDEEALEEINNAAELNAEAVEDVLDSIRTGKDMSALTALLEDTAAVPTPASRRYVWDVTPEYVDASTYLDENPAEVAEEIAARVRVGQTYEVTHSGQVKWTPAAPVQNSAPSTDDEEQEEAPEPTPEEIAAAQARDQAAADLSTIRTAVTQCLLDAFRQKSPLQALVAHKVLQEQAMRVLEHAVTGYGRTEYRALLLEVLGLPDTRDPEQYEEHIFAPARRLFASKTWEWLVAFDGLTEHSGAFYAMAQLNNITRSYEEAQVWEAVATLENQHGLTVTATKDRLREWLHPDQVQATDEADDVTAECEDCGQTVAKDTDWEGICKACSPGVEDDDR